jgi:hypothetical protein
LQQYVQELLQAIEHYAVHAIQEAKAAIADLDVDFIREDFPRLIGAMHTGSERIRDLIASLKTFARLDESAEALDRFRTHGRLGNITIAPYPCLDRHKMRCQNNARG